MNSEEYQKLIKEKMSGRDFIEFNGWNCHDIGTPENDACRGWDGESRRCDCGNRRVCWESDDEETVYAQAW